MRKKIDLATAKEMLETDTVFLGQGNTFMVADFGKYNPNITFIIPNEWSTDNRGQLESPLKYVTEKRLTGNMNIDFNATKEEMIFGEAFKSKSGKQMFKLTSPDKAKDCLIRADWGGCFRSSRGQSKSYAESIGVQYFRSASSNGGGAGNDYYIVPVGFVAGREESRDVKDILKELSEKEEKRIADNEKIYREGMEKARLSREGRAEFQPKLEEVLIQLKDIAKRYNFFQESFSFEEDFLRYGGSNKPYSKETLDELSTSLEKLKQYEQNRSKFIGQFEEMKLIAEASGCTMSMRLQTVEVINKDNHRECFKFDINGATECMSYLGKEYEKMQQAAEAAREKAREIAAQIKKEAAEKNAKELGYPSDFSYYNRIYGATNQSHAYVIRPNGEIRENDSLEFSNPNHRYKFSDPIHTADGIQHWNQILPGEIIIAYTKACSAEPVQTTIEWMPEQVTPAQMEAIQEITDDLKKTYCKPVDWDELLKTTPPSLLKEETIDIPNIDITETDIYTAPRPKETVRAEQGGNQPAPVAENDTPNRDTQGTDEQGDDTCL